jgi:GH35 family endo-1,4-beta-xylanase
MLINDYRTDPPYAALMTRLVELAGKRPFDVIGIQSHMHGGAWTNTRIWEVCERFAKFGVPLHFTETTILSGKRGWEMARKGEPWLSTAEGEKYQAENVERFYTMLFSHPAVAALTWWDFTDRGAWQRAPAGFLRADLSPKPAYESLRHLIKEKWWTRTKVKTNEKGKAHLRAFLGEHQVTVRLETEQKATERLSLQKGASNRVTVTLP